MAEYDLIERNIIFEKVTELYRYSKGDMHIAYRELLDYILDMPAADVQRVKHGYWIKQPEKFQNHEDVINSNYWYSCSCCNASDLHSERANNNGEVKFCWRCGAKMTESEMN